MGMQPPWKERSGGANNAWESIRDVRGENVPLRIEEFNFDDATRRSPPKWFRLRAIGVVPGGVSRQPPHPSPNPRTKCKRHQHVSCSSLRNQPHCSTSSLRRLAQTDFHTPTSPHPTPHALLRIRAWMQTEDMYVEEITIEKQLTFPRHDIGLARRVY